jgi:hypothetical protein
LFSVWMALQLPLLVINNQRWSETVVAAALGAVHVLQMLEAGVQGRARVPHRSSRVCGGKSDWKDQPSYVASLRSMALCGSGDGLGFVTFTQHLDLDLAY